MVKFEALDGATALIVPFIERDEKGQIVRDQSIPFNQGISLRDKTIPAYIIPTDPDQIKFLRAYKGNQANGGYSYREIKEAQASKPATEAKSNATPVDLPKHAPAAVVTELPNLEEADKEFVFPDDLAETPDPGSKDYPDVTTAQEASVILRSLFPELTVRDTSSKAKIKAFIADKNITFSNLEL